MSRRVQVQVYRSANMSHVCAPHHLLTYIFLEFYIQMLKSNQLKLNKININSIKKMCKEKREKPNMDSSPQPKSDETILTILKKQYADYGKKTRHKHLKQQRQKKKSTVV